MATADKLQKLLETKEQIRHSIEKKGVEIGDDVVFADYPNKIAEIEAGGEELVGDYVILRFDSNLDSASDFLKRSSEIELNFDISNVTDMNSMFQGCENLRTINGINEWDTSNVTNMGNMFHNCRSLELLDLSSFNTSNVWNMWEIFSECENLKELNLSSFEIREDCDTNYMLNNCRRLHTLRLDNCNEDTIRKIIESAGFPTGGAEDYEGTRKIYVNRSFGSSTQPPGGWEFVRVD